EDEVDPDPEIAEREAEEAGREPTEPPHLVPAVGDVAPEALGDRPRVGLHAHRGHERHADEEARRVYREAPAGAGGDDDRAGDNRPEDTRAALGHRDQRVRLLQVARAYGLREA